MTAFDSVLGSRYLRFQVNFSHRIVPKLVLAVSIGAMAVLAHAEPRPDPAPGSTDLGAAFSEPVHRGVELNKLPKAKKESKKGDEKKDDDKPFADVIKDFE